MNVTLEHPTRLAGRTRFGRRVAARAGATLSAAALLGTGAAGHAAAQGTIGGPIEPRAGTWRPWLLTSGSQYRPAPPPDRATTDVEMRELKALAGRRDAATLDRIKFWD